MSITHIPERTENLDPGFAYRKTRLRLYFKDLHQFSASSMFQGFDACALAAIFSVIIGFIILLGISSPNSCDIYEYVVACLMASKAVLGQPFELNQANSSKKKTLAIQGFFLSLFGGFVFWSFTGILTSLIVVKTAQIPLLSLDDLQWKGSDFKLHAFRGGSTQTFLEQWASVPEKPIQMAMYQKFIEPYYLKSWHQDVCPKMMATNDQNTVFLLEDHLLSLMPIPGMNS